MRVLALLLSSLLLCSASSCALDTRPKSHEVCTDPSTYNVVYLERAGNCGPISDKLNRLRDFSEGPCTQLVTWDDMCGAIIHNDCPDYSLTIAVSRSSKDGYEGFAELRTTDCAGLYTVTLTKVK